MAVSTMMRDRSGALWLGSERAWIKRLVNGEALVLQPTEGLPDTHARAFYQDSRGWLWIGLRFRGVSMTTDPTTDRPSFVNYSTQNGLASDAVLSIAEDELGRIYLGTGRGLDQLDPFTGRIRHFTTRDGLAGDIVNHCMKDHHGNIWVATSGGISRLNPRAERLQHRPPTVYLSRVEVAGEQQSVPERGALRLGEMTFPGSQNNLLIEYVGLDFQSEQSVKYQYKLESVDAGWSEPTSQPSVNYARLSAGSYRFLVRAINQQGIASMEPAVFEFRILAPIWLRWWFLTLTAGLAVAIIYAAHRYRVTRLVELERIRTRIATDLHDDIGSTLSKIALMSEVVHKQVGRVDPRVSERLSAIASNSRELVDSMSDIVWAVNPKRDRLSDLAGRMRRFADDLFSARDIAFHFSASGTERDVKLGSDIRREVFLVYKESVNNVVRHSGSTTAEVYLRIEGRSLVLRVSDNGRGFDAVSESGGNGLVSMRQRAKKLGGEFEIISNNGRGTTLMLKVPLNRRN